MTLHEAIVKLLIEFGRPMTTKEIADELNQNKWYQKKKKSPIDSFQIHGRTRNYSQLFGRDGSTVFLLNRQDKPPNRTTCKTRTVRKQTKKITTEPISIDQLEQDLMTEKHFQNASLVDNLIPYSPGLYCIRVKNIKMLPSPFNEELADRQHNIIYIGIASRNLSKRLLNQELRAKGHGTFFRSIGAVLGYTPPEGSLANKSTRNYKFSDKDELRIIQWINDNLMVNWVVHVSNFETIEAPLIHKYLPLLNIAKNPSSLQVLSELRAECVRVARKN